MSRASGVLLLLAASLHTPAAAQALTTEGEDPFCLLLGGDLLAALDGTWTLTQGAGRITHPIPQPLRPVEPITVRMAYDPEVGVVDMQGPDLSDGMILFPTAEPQQEAALVLIEDGVGGSFEGGCAWSDTPVLTGTNAYLSTGQDLISWQLRMRYCERSVADSIANGPQGWGYWFPRDTYGCYEERPRPREFQMEMTLLLRFQSPDRAAGMVYFDGTMNGWQFGARAPVIMSR